MIFKNKSERDRPVPSTLALAPAVLIVVFSVFSALLIQINQRGIELVVMSSWEKRFLPLTRLNFLHIISRKKNGGKRASGMKVIFVL
ncbi:hypothetical protein OJE16_20665 [Pantoea tagorei]